MNLYYHIFIFGFFMLDKGIFFRQVGNFVINYLFNFILGGYFLIDSSYNIRLFIKEEMGELKYDSVKVDLYFMADDKGSLGVMNFFSEVNDQISLITFVL